MGCRTEFLQRKDRLTELFFDFERPCSAANLAPSALSLKSQVRGLLFCDHQNRLGERVGGRLKTMQKSSRLLQIGAKSKKSVEATGFSCKWPKRDCFRVCSCDFFRVSRKRSSGEPCATHSAVLLRYSFCCEWFCRCALRVNVRLDQTSVHQKLALS